MYNNEFVESDLITPIQWENTMQWLYNSGYNIEDSKEWGNFLNVNFKFTVLGQRIGHGVVKGMDAFDHQNILRPQL